METHIQEWLSLLLRWLHFITGVAWIGASFYFNWLENQLERQHKPSHLAGDLWAVHGGGFYYLQKYKVAPPKLPETLHWFKWEAYATWITGFLLLSLVYYADARLFMIDPQVAQLSNWQAIAIGLASLLVSWLFYDLLCRSPLRRSGGALIAVIFLYFVGLAWLLTELLSGRAAYIHLGAAIGTIMVANVFRVIIPSQKELVTAVEEQGIPDPEYGQNALLRSRHNNYFTLPVLFIMISNHYPGTFGHSWNWVLLTVIALAGIALRHYFNIRHLGGAKIWALLLAIILFLGLVVATLPRPAGNGDVEIVTTQALMPVIQQRCSNCHAEKPGFAGFSAPPAGVVLESESQLEALAERVYQATVVGKTMPLGNITAISEAERTQIALWYQGLDQNR